MIMIHQTNPYLLKPEHKVTVDLIGVGGTGSQVLTNLAKMNEALMGLQHPGLHVRAWDDDIVSTSNMGRQLFSPSDIGQYKSAVSITRINRFFGYEWQSVNQKYGGTQRSNITITCVDTAAARIEIGKKLEGFHNGEPTDKPYYWLDIGNLQKTGQVVLGTIDIKMPHPFPLQTVVKMFPQLKKIKEKDQGPSCSLAEALSKQDLFINPILANFGCNLLWKLLREGEIKHHGCYVNLETMVVNPIKI